MLESPTRSTTTKETREVMVIEVVSEESHTLDLPNSEEVLVGGRLAQFREKWPFDP